MYKISTTENYFRQNMNQKRKLYHVLVKRDVSSVFERNVAKYYYVRKSEN